MMARKSCKSWKHSVLALSVAAAAMVVVPLFHPVSSVTAAPQPSVVPVSWELDFDSHPPERLVVANDKGEKQVFWYIRFKVANNTKDDLLFTPEFQLITETGQVIDSGVTATGKPLPPAIFEQIKKLYHNDLMNSPIEVLGRLKQGPDNARESVAIFADVDKEARKFRIVATGLYGEVATVKNPLTDKPVILKKALILDYDVPGEAIGIPPSAKLREKSFAMK